MVPGNTFGCPRASPKLAKSPNGAKWCKWQKQRVHWIELNCFRIEFNFPQPCVKFNHYVSQLEAVENISSNEDVEDIGNSPQPAAPMLTQSHILKEMVRFEFDVIRNKRGEFYPLAQRDRRARWKTSARPRTPRLGQKQPRKFFYTSSTNHKIGNKGSNPLKFQWNVCAGLLFLEISKIRGNRPKNAPFSTFSSILSSDFSALG